MIAQDYRLRNRWLRNGHIQTIAGNYWPRKLFLPTVQMEAVEVDPARDGLPAIAVQCDCHWQPEAVRGERPTIFLLHGVGGSSRSHYVRGNASKAFRAGCNAVRINLRNCGDALAPVPALYNAGQSGDLRAVVEYFAGKYGLRSIAVAGYSMGGNLALKYAGECGDAPPPWLKAVVGISPAIDLSASSDALHLWRNRIYEKKFLQALISRYVGRARMFPQHFDADAVRRTQSLRDFDTRVVARYCGYADAEDYYRHATSANVIDKISVPTLIVHAQDDPFIRLTPPTRAKLMANPHIQLIETAHGGHCAFLAPPSDGPEDFDGYWAEHALLDFVLAHAK
jgi:predicted alpha/beta-fold hydrolase